MSNTLLIVEESYIFSMILEKMAAKLGFNTVGVANNESKALVLAKKHNPDLIFLGLNLSGDDSKGLIDSIRSTTTSKMVFIASSFNSTANVNLLEEESYIITKPFMLDELQTVARNALGLKVFIKEKPLELH